MSLIYSDDIRETITDLCYRHIDLAVCFIGFADKIIWIRKDFISISWFWSNQQDSTSRFRSVRCLCLAAQMSVFPLDSLVLCQLFRIISEILLVTAFQVVLKMNLDSLLSFPPPATSSVRQNLHILSRTLGLDFVLRPPKIPFTISHRI